MPLLLYPRREHMLCLNTIPLALFIREDNYFALYTGPVLVVLRKIINGDQLVLLKF